MLEPQHWKKASRKRNRDRLTDHILPSALLKASLQLQMKSRANSRTPRFGTALSVTQNARRKTKVQVNPTRDLKGQVTKDLQKSALWESFTLSRDSMAM